LVDEPSEPAAEEVARAAERTVEMLKASQPEERFAQDEQRPLVANQVERTADRAILRAVR